MGGGAGGGGSWGKIHSRGVGGSKMLRGVDAVRGTQMRQFEDEEGGMGGGVTHRGRGYPGGAEWVTAGGANFGEGGDAGRGLGEALHATAYAGHHLDAQVAYAEHQLVLKTSYTSSLRPHTLVA